MKTKTKEAADKARAEARAEEMARMATDAIADKHNILLYNECLNRYINSMRKSLSESDSFYSQMAFQQIHDDAKRSALTQVR